MSKKNVEKTEQIPEQKDARMVNFDMGDVICKVEEYARKRARHQAWKYHGTSKEEVEFFTGAMAMFFALGVQDLIPASWALGPSVGKPILPDIAEAQQEK